MRSTNSIVRRILEVLGRPSLLPAPVPVRPRETEGRPITMRDKKMIMKHIDELFAVESRGDCRQTATPAVQDPITEEDQALIMKHSDELFAGSGAGSADTPQVEPGPITEEDKVLIMEHVDKLFYNDGDRRGGRPGEAEPSN